MKKKIIWLVASCSIVVALLLASCGPAVTEEEEVAPPGEEEVVTAEEEAAPPEEEEAVTEEEVAPPTPPADTTPPSPITGLVATNAYDGRVNVWWDKTAATDFGHYNVYLNEVEMADITGMKPTRQIKGIAACRYQVAGLEDGTKYYVVVTAVDKSGNEDVRVDSVSAMPVPMPEGTKDSGLAVEVYQPDRVWAGTTFLPLSYVGSHRIVEVNMLGEVVWEYVVPQRGTFEAELLPNDHILYTVSAKGVYEIDRSGKLIWSYQTNKIDHDADLLPNGNTIFVFGFGDQKSDAQVTEVNSKGQIVWSWSAKDHLDVPPYNSIYDDGWVHTNAVIRLPNGNTLISLRNFDMVVEVDPEGAIVRKIGEGILLGIHDPEVLPNGNILGALPAVRNPVHAIEINPKNDAVVWQFRWPSELMPQCARDTNRLPNGNTLISGSTAIVEVTPQGEIVWQLRLQGVTTEQVNAGTAFYKADRISIQR